MANVVIYTTEHCPYCQRAKSLLKQKGVAYTEVNLEGKPDELKALKDRTGMRTVPQIFIGDELIGGFTDLLALEQANTLDSKLSS